MVVLKHKELSEKIIAAAFTVHKELGYGFVEKVYKNALAIELGEVGIKCAVEVPLRVLYHGKTVGDYYADMIIEDKIIVETKAVSDLEPIHEVQLVNYLKATGLHVGLLINFGQSVKVKRRVFGYDADED
ncbi:MAG: GxxExxY protein [Phycisphaerae bacterium]|nr:GxxExxY protein [Phycisphaerae bacterium]